jgi:hypothetical protein
LPGTVEVPLFATDGVGHRQHGHGVAHLALPELLIAAVSVVEDVFGRASLHGPVGLIANLFPHRGVRALHCLTEFCGALACQVNPRMNPTHFLQGRGKRLQAVGIPEAETLDGLQPDIGQVGVDLAGPVGPLFQG